MKNVNVIAVLMVCILPVIADVETEMRKYCKEGMASLGTDNIYELYMYGIQASRTVMIEEQDQTFIDYFDAVFSDKPPSSRELLEMAKSVKIKNSSYNLNEVVAITYAIKCKDFKLVDNITIPHNSTFLAIYLHEPLSDGVKPKDIKVWESILRKQYRRELDLTRSSYFSDRSGSVRLPDGSLEWLAQHGSSEETKKLLLLLPFEHMNFLKTYHNKLHGVEFIRERFGENASGSNVVEWYINDILGAAGLIGQFDNDLKEMERYFSVLRSALQEGVRVPE